MFKDSDHEFMSKNMKIVVKSIESKLNEPFFAEFKEIATYSISRYIEIINDFKLSGLPSESNHPFDNKIQLAINAHFEKIAEKISNENVHQVLDALRESFSCYASNGLYELYTRQKNEYWHPKIVLNEILEPNDIALLPDVFTLYRGCDIEEPENSSFGQSWTTCLKCAKEFAFEHYRDMDWFDKSKRVVLEATYHKKDVLFSKQSIEYEVVVDTGKLGYVRKYLE